MKKARAFCTILTISALSNICGVGQRLLPLCRKFKHSSLFRKGFNDQEKKFYNNNNTRRGDPRGNVIKLFSSLLTWKAEVFFTGKFFTG